MAIIEGARAVRAKPEQVLKGAYGLAAPGTPYHPLTMSSPSNA